MGDVVHALPALSDMLDAHPSLQVDWLVERPFASLPAMHPGLHRVLPMAWRSWRRRLWARDVREAMGKVRAAMREAPYDLVLDLQGLIKSAVWARQALGPVAGYGRDSARESLASVFYHRHAMVSRDLHAVERNRRLAAAHLGYPMPSTPPRFGIVAPTLSTPDWSPPDGHAALIIGGSRPASLWPDDHWLLLAKALAARGVPSVPIWGNPAEQARAQALADSVGGSMPPFLSIPDTAAVLGSARVVVGHDTGFTHLAAALGRPTVSLNRDQDVRHTGATGDGPIRRVGGKGALPTQDEVQAAVDAVLEEAGGRPNA